MHSSVVFWSSRAYSQSQAFEKRRKKGYPKAKFTQISAKSKKGREKVDLGKFTRKKEILDEGRKKGEFFIKCGSTELKNLSRM